jgi:DNA-binding beta-propeller fold protein YncE
MQATHHRLDQSNLARMRLSIRLLPPAALLLVVGCTASAEDVRPFPDKIFFPTGLAIAPDESVLFVANANSELRYDSGAIFVIDLMNVDDIVNQWITNQAIPDSCTQDTDHIETITCEDSPFISAQAGVRVGNFATDIAVQDRGSGRLRLIIPTRGDPSIAWADWDGTQLSCNSGAEGFALCDDRHRLSFAATDPDIGIPAEPFGVFADSANEFAMVTHLTTGAVTLIDSPADGDAVITDVQQSVFLPDPNTGLRGSTGVAGRTPTSAGDIVYVASRSEDRIATFTVGRPVNGAPPFLLDGNYFFLDSVGGNTGNSTDTRGMTFSPTGNAMYLVNRKPPSLQIWDTSLDETGFPKNKPIGATDICRQGSTIAVADSGDGERAYVTCFQDGQLYIVDPRSTVQAEDIVLVGRGPYSVVAAPTRKKVFVTNFLEDTIVVIDTTPNAPTRNRVVLRIGIPRNLK